MQTAKKSPSILYLAKLAILLSGRKTAPNHSRLAIGVHITECANGSYMTVTQKRFLQ